MVLYAAPMLYRFHHGKSGCDEVVHHRIGGNLSAGVGLEIRFFVMQIEHKQKPCV